MRCIWRRLLILNDDVCDSGGGPKTIIFSFSLLKHEALKYEKNNNNNSKKKRKDLFVSFKYVYILSRFEHVYKKKDE